MSTITKVIFGALFLIAGYSIGVFIASKIKVRKDEEIAKAIIDHLQIENELTNKLKYESIINYVIDTKGIEYAIGYFGQDYMILNNLKNKDDSQKKIEESLKVFLKNALNPEIKKYTEEQNKKQSQDKVSELKEKIYSDIKH